MKMEENLQKIVVIKSTYRSPIVRIVRTWPFTIGYGNDCTLRINDPLANFGKYLVKFDKDGSGIVARPLDSAWNSPKVFLNRQIILDSSSTGVKMKNGDTVGIHFGSPFHFGLQVCYFSECTRIGVSSINKFLELPKRAKIEVLTNLEPVDLLFGIAPVCSILFDLVKDPRLWKSFGNVSELPNDAISDVLQLSGDNVESIVIKLTLYSDIPPWVFSSVNSSKLKEFSLSFCDNWDGKLPYSIIPMISRCRNLKRIRLENFKDSVPGFGFEALHNVEQLTVRSDERAVFEVFISEESRSNLDLIGIFAGLPNLKFLCLGFGFFLDGTKWDGSALPGFESLQKLTFKESIIEGFTVNPLSFMVKTLTCLHVPVDGQIEMLEVLENLKVLVLEGPHDPDFDLISFFPRLRSRLRVLKMISSNALSNDALIAIASGQGSSLEAFHAHHCSELSDNGITAFLRLCGSLKWLDISGRHGLRGDSAWIGEIENQTRFVFMRIADVYEFSDARSRTIFAKFGNLHALFEKDCRDVWIDDFDEAFFLPDFLDFVRTSI
ncbi:unnamed protein product [Notodromas monacha]|uniref:F-box domain-containing protein n=1 Tax=Notodromas monacha TaxID=399045 RepID=A0A7R9GKQ8_9CRUS|nr:unnamed protein product [Notodromas monacha]CAG0924164.1 unnamed protein product [Notodromas monacha]